MRKDLTRRQFLKASAFLGLGGFLGLRSCEDLFKTGPSLVFEQLDSGCASADEWATLQGGEGRITFSGTMATPNPCYDLNAELMTMRCGPGARCPNTYEVAIASEPLEGYCIECLGGVSYRGEIRGLEPGLYSITIVHDGRPIAEAEVEIG
jgi:hypothetical protein